MRGQSNWAALSHELARCLSATWQRQASKTAMSHVIALVDDDRNILTSVSIALQQEGFVTRVYSDPVAALKAINDNPPDIGVFDIKMPNLDGMELLRRVREFSSMPVIFLTSKDDELDEALGLAMGADDYISKPFSQRLLIARIRAILRRQELERGEAAAATGRGEPPALERGRLMMDPARHKVRWDGKDVSLTVTEFLILEALAQRPGVVKTRNQLLDVAYNDDVYVDDRTIDSHIKRIRRKFRSVDPEIRCNRDPLWRRLSIRRIVKRAASLALSWSGRWTLTHRILALNVLTLLLVALSTLYLDAFRHRLSKERTQQTRLETATAVAAMGHVPASQWPALLATASKVTSDRFRLYGADGSLLIDSWRMTGPTYEFRDPSTREMDARMSPGRSIAGSTSSSARDRSTNMPSPKVDRLEAWPEAVKAPQLGRATTEIRNAPDLTPVISSAVPFEAACCLRPTTTAPSPRRFAGSAR